MNLKLRHVGQVTAIDIEGKLDTNTSTLALEQLLAHLADSPPQVVISLAALEFASSAGLRVLLRVAKHVRGYSGELKVAGATGMVKEVLEISGFDTLLNMYDSEEQALAAFG